MTAEMGDFGRPVSGARERLAEAMFADNYGYTPTEASSLWQAARGEYEARADALLPVVDALADERAADALEQAGEDLAPIRAGLASRVSAQAGAQAAWCANWLRDRAASLRAASRGEAGR